MEGSLSTTSMICTLTDPTTVIIPIHKYAAADFLTLDITDTLRSKVVNGNFSNNEIEIELS